MITFDSETKAIFDPPSLNLVGNPQKAIMIFDDEVWEDYIIKDESLATFPAKNSKGRVFNTFRIFKSNNENILLIYPCTGGSASASDLELLIASGIKTVVAFGTCGAMDDSISKNTIIIPTAAIREEGVSYHYLAPSDEVVQNQDSINTICDIVSKNHLEYLKGKVWTTDAVYRETFGKLTSLKANGCIAVDMELASLLAVAQFRKIKFAEFLIADDNIAGVCDKVLERAPEKLLKVALDILLDL